MNEKRGQITIFIIIGTVVLVLSIFIFYMTVNLQKAATEVSLPTESVRAYVISCLKDVGDKSAWVIGFHGGYINPAEYTYYQGEKVAFLEPSRTLKDIEEDFSDYIAAEIKTCLNFQSFEDMGFNITKPDSVSANVTIAPRQITVRLHYPLTIEKGQSKSELSDFSVNLPIRLGALYSDAVNLNNEIRNNPLFNLADPDNCNKYLGNGLTNIYCKKNGYGEREIIQFMDFETYRHFYMQTYIFQFAVKGANIEGTRCVPQNE